MPTDLYVVRPDPRGYTLEGPRLPFRLLFLNETNAVSHARWVLRDRGGRVIVLDSRSTCIVTEWVAREPTGLHACGTW